MSYISKTWVDRDSEYPTRRVLTYIDPTTQESVDLQVTVSRDEGTISQEGDPFDASNMNGLESRINSAFSDVIVVLTGASDPTSSIGKDGDIYAKTSAGSIVAVWIKVSGSWLELPTGGSGGSTVYLGTTDPDISLGENGNLYIKYHTDGTPVVDAFYVKISGAWASVSTGGGGGLVGLELTQAQYDALTPAEKMNGTVYFVTDGTPTVLDDYQLKEDNSLSTTSKLVVGAINELNSSKQNSVNSLMIGRGNLPSGTNLRNIYNSGTYYLSGTYSGSPTSQNIDGIMEVYSSVSSGYSAYFHQRLLWLNTSNKMVVAERLVINDSDKGWKVIWTEQ